MFNIAITAGGTSENIDGVRKITNVSTGSLGWHCLEALIEYFNTHSDQEFHLYYIHTENALTKQLNKNEKSHVTFIPVTDSASVYNEVDKLTKEVSLDYFIHAMAISDFTFAYAASVYELARELTGFRTNDGADELKVKDVLENPQSKYSDNEKISSDTNIVMGLKRTKKVIPLIKQNNPKTFLVGFKLLRGADESQLMNEAGKLTSKNDCDMVFANEVSHISENNHRGILIKDGKIIARPSGKKEIAKSIIKHIFEK